MTEFKKSWHLIWLSLNFLNNRQKMKNNKIALSNRLFNARIILILLILSVSTAEYSKYHRMENVIRFKLSIDEKILKSITERSVRMPKPHFINLVNILSADLIVKEKKRLRDGEWVNVNVTPLQICYIGIRFLCGSNYLDICSFFSSNGLLFAISTFYFSLHRFFQCVNECKYLQIQFEPRKIDQYLQSWKHMGGSCIDGIYGALDGTEIKFNSSTKKYFNYKGFKSIKVIAMVNSLHEFIFAEVTGFGSINDAKALRETSLYTVLKSIHSTIEKINDFQILENNEYYQTCAKFENAIILTDGGFGREVFNIKPYRKNQVTPGFREFFNKIHCSRRIVIEQAFGELKMTFNLFQRALRNSFDHAKIIIEAAFKLHNYRLKYYNESRKSLEERIMIFGKRAKRKFEVCMNKINQVVELDETINEQSNDIRREELALKLWNEYNS